MFSRLLGFGCLSTALGIAAAVIVVAVIFPIPFGILAMFFLGAKMQWDDNKFEPREAIVQGYERICAPAPDFVSSTQPKCSVGGRAGALLTLVTLRYPAGEGSWQIKSIKTTFEFGRPAIGSHVSVLVHSRDPEKFKLNRNGRVNPGWCERPDC